MNALRAALLIAVGLPSLTEAQTTTDSLRLSALRVAAASGDPRAAQLELLASQSALRIRNINAELKPSLSLDGLAQYQSDVAGLNVDLPGIKLPKPTNDTYDARLGALQRIYDPSIRPRRAAEQAQLAESRARVKSAIYSLNETANSAFFVALRSQTQIAELETTARDLEAQIAVAESRIRAGTALQSESSTLHAELLRRRQSIAEQRSAQRAAIAILVDLTGQKIDPDIPIAIPDLQSAVTEARTAGTSLRARPEYEQFESSRNLLALTEIVRSAQQKPRLSAFGRAGYGRPGLNPLSDKFDTYWLSGLQFEWTPWTWGNSSRGRQISRLQGQIISTEEQAFTAQLQRSIEQDIASIDRLESTVADDEQIISLRESILAEARSRYREAVITSAEYVDRQTDVLSARLARAIHRVELAQARARLLTTLGMEVR
jgi:outer membrane protein TolC